MSLLSREYHKNPSKTPLDASVISANSLDDQSFQPKTLQQMIARHQLAEKPFGHAEYVADLHTRDDGHGDISFQAITLGAFALDATNPGTSQDQSGQASGVQLEHLGMWFSSLQDAQKVLNDDTLKGTIFDGGNPPLHAGPQAMTDGQTLPVI